MALADRVEYSQKLQSIMKVMWFCSSFGVIVKVMGINHYNNLSRIFTGRLMMGVLALVPSVTYYTCNHEGR